MKLTCRIIRKTPPRQLAEITVSRRIPGGWISESWRYNPSTTGRRLLARTIWSMRTRVRHAAESVTKFERRYINVQYFNSLLPKMKAH